MKKTKITLLLSLLLSLLLIFCSCSIEKRSPLDFYPLPDGTYGVKAGKAMYLEKIIIPDTYRSKPVTTILPNGFGGSNGNTAVNLVEITIPKTITTIGENAFEGCSKINNIVIPDSVTSIGNSAFSNCSSLTNITIPNSVTYIGSCAFLYCSSLKSITIPDSIKTINDHTFMQCYNLTSIIIPNSVNYIDRWAFESCYNLQSVYYAGPANDWSEIHIYNDDYGNYDLVNSTIYFYSETEPTEEGNFWHWGENGEVVVWE